jgi:hypothetical protein
MLLRVLVDRREGVELADVRASRPAIAGKLAPPRKALRRYLVEEADDAGQTSVSADGRDVKTDNQRVIPVAA